MTQRLGLIAGEGRLPILVAQGAKAAGVRVSCIGLRDQFDPLLPFFCDDFKQAGIIQIGRWIRQMNRWRIDSAIMVGRVKKVRMYDPFYLVRQMPDWRAVKLWFGRLRHDKRNDAILGAVADELAAGGVTLIDSTQYLPQHMAGEGVMTPGCPPGSCAGDVEFALPILWRLAELDIGQSIAVKDREIVAVEAIEGTDAMIRRAGELCKRGGWTLLKIAKPQQDMRFDVPTIGINTVENVKAAGGACIAVEAGKVIMIDKPKLIEAAQKAGVAIVGIRI